MAQILVRNLSDQALEALRLRAARENIPLERLVRNIIHEAAKPRREELLERARQLREKYGLMPDDSTALIREDRDSR
jgi:plasmid stability protein